MGIGTVLACKQTLHLESVLTPHLEVIDEIQLAEKNEKLPDYTTKKATDDKAKVVARVAQDMGRLYWVPAVTFVGGAALVFGGHRVMVKRNATLALAFTGLQKAFAGYRQRVSNEFGPAADAGMMDGFVKKQIVDPETGTSSVVATRDWDGDLGDPYNRIFGQGDSDEWVNDLGVNKMFLEHQRKYAQEVLNRQGYLYLSEVYKALGFPESDVSRVVGWKVTRNPDGSKHYPFVDFGLDKKLPDDWTYSKDKAVYLDFNCQGLIVGGKIQKILEKA